MVVIAAILFSWLFLTMTFIPIIRNKHQRKQGMKIHGEIPSLQNLSVKPAKRIAVSLDFSLNDEKLIAYAIGQGSKEADYILLHIVESVAARFSGEQSDDEETRIDKERLQSYVHQLQALGYKVELHLGYTNRVKEIVRIVKESEADMLVMGAHRHSGVKDYLFGETIESVRHSLHIPVLIVNV